MVSEYFNNDTSNTAEDYDKVLHGLKLRWTREISMFEEFNSDVLAQIGVRMQSKFPDTGTVLAVAASRLVVTIIYWL